MCNVSQKNRRGKRERGITLTEEKHLAIIVERITLHSKHSKQLKTFSYCDENILR